MKELKELVKDVERDLVIGLATSTKYKRITFDESKKIAKEFINYYPFANFEDLFERLNFLSTKYRVVRKVYVKYSPAYFEEKSEYVLSKMRNYLKRREIDEAISVARRVNYAKI